MHQQEFKKCGDVKCGEKKIDKNTTTITITTKTT
jgi:hypothetical protein